MRSGAAGKMNLSYMLALNLIYLIKGASTGAYARLNAVAMAHALVRAMTAEKAQQNKGEELKNRIETINKLIDIKRQDYLPAFEPSHEYAEYNVDARTRYEAELYEIVSELLLIIEEEDLISHEAIGEAWESGFTKPE